MTATLPNHASVVVIGGGVMGCSVLYHLAKLGISDAILVERNQLTSGTTWHSAAQVRALRSTRNMTELIRYSIELYSSLEKETGQATGWINKGSLSIATNEDRLTHIKRQESLAKLFGVEASSISAGEAAEIWPLMNTDDVIGAVWSPGDGRVSPSDLCAALVRGAKSRGAKIFEETGVEGIVTEGGRVVAVETSRGRIQTDAIAICTGLWSREAARMAGTIAPVWPCEHFYLLTKPIEGITGNVPSLSDHDSHLYIRDDSGGLLVGCFEPNAKQISPDTLGKNFAFQLLPEDWDHFEPMMINALHRLPPLETAEVKTLLNGPESFTPDGSFLLGEAPETRGVFLGCGMNSVGVATGGGAGMALAHNIVNGHMPMDLHEVDPARFPGCWNEVGALSARVPEVLGKHYEITYPSRQWDTARHIRRVPLHDEWADADAHFGQVYGYERPMYFGKTTAPTLTFGKPDWFDHVASEVNAAHTGVALFDQSTLGKINVSGPDAETFLNRVCTNDMARTPGSVMFSLLLNDSGGIEDDLTALRLDGETYRLSVGTASVRRVMGWLSQNTVDDERVSIKDETDQFATLALTGPKASALVASIGAAEMNDIKYFRHAALDIGGVPVLVARMSYVGEAGWEITCAHQHASQLYAALQGAGAQPAGMFAQTSMRIEKQFLAYGHDMDTDTSPLATPLGFAIAWETDFVGRDALQKLKEQPNIKRRVVSLVLDDPNAWPIGNEPIYIGDEIVGQTTSASYGHRARAHVAIASLDESAIDAHVDVDIAGKKFSARSQSKPAFDPTGSRMRAQ
jgi:glycine cleavage system aminomethyltransferase T/glycine/D-amino acid oxidase-like deaminating enzyme